MPAHRPWLAAYGDMPAEIDADAHPSVVALLDEAMQRHANRTAFVAFGQRLSYGEVDRLSARLAGHLQRDLGVAKGDRVAVMLPNLAAFPIALLAIARIGAVQVNVNPLYTPRELAHQLQDSGSKVIVIFNGATPTLAGIIGQTGVQTVITAAPGDGLPVALPAPPVDARLAHAIPLASILGGADPGQYLTPPLAGTDLLFLQYTGGTTGVSKGAALSHRNIIANVQQFKAIAPNALREGREVVVTAIPLYHIFALTTNFICCFSIGAENWLVPNPRDMEAFINVLRDARPTLMTGVNTIFAGIAAHPRAAEIDFSRLRLAGGGGTAVVEATAQRWQALTGTSIREGYGLSETSPIVSFNTEQASAFNGTTGVPVPSTDVRLLTEAGQDAAPGESGEVCVKGPQVMSGYWQQPEASAAAFTADGYFRTGDIGVFTPEGLLKIVDRKKDMIIVSGFNVFPNEVEAVAMACPGVAEAACVGVADERSGEAVRLYAVRTPGSELTAEQLLDHCRGEMTAYKVPRQVVFIDALPKSAVGKVLRRELRDSAA
ncbi:AMP-binding protein [Pelomonas sp. KK5]|uniref:AMP-binding protein n=1 Tax=Pelomonas sp. KK5 TaxID=1855730 RepID=UPI00097C8C98|nr:AMP-binding protein [Pelomonas sp. KK5]